MEVNEVKNTDHKALWKAARWGVIIFCILHIFYEIITGNKSAGFPVFINFMISRWYIKGQIAKGKEIKNLMLMGLFVAGVVFLIRLALGAIVYLAMDK